MVLTNNYFFIIAKKGFKLKRRKKVNLIAAGSADKLDSTTNISGQNSFSCNSLNETTTGELTPNKKAVKLTTAATGGLNNKFASNGSLSNNVKNIFPSITMNKCACCSCKLLTTRQGDVDIFEAKDIASWGTGLLVVTKFINSKNITKLVNYKCLKHIWVNNNIARNDSSSADLDVASSLLEELGF
jgi:hypothetical protein